MSLRIKLSVLLITLISVDILACDICGNYMGLTPYQNKNSISLAHRYRVFNGYHYYQSRSEFFPKKAYRTMHGTHTGDSLMPVINTHSSKDFESFKVFELRLKYFIHRRVEVNAFIPVISNRSQFDGVLNKHTGFGDISLNVGYHLILPDDEKMLKQKLVIGAGVKLPTGNCNALDIANRRLTLEMQCGTGSVDGFAYFNYFLICKNIGMNLNSSFKVNGTNSHQEKICNSSAHSFSLFYKCRINQLGIFPSAQASYEYTKGVMFNDRIDPGSGVSCLMLGPGLDFYYKSFSLNASWQFTIAEKIAKDELESAGRISVGLNYMFGGKNK